MLRLSHAILGAAFAALSAAGTLAETGQQPYAGQDRRAVKALSADEIADLLAGRGMGLAKAAELNGYPGPAHLLENADALKLTDGQRRAVAAIRARMAEAATALGREIAALMGRLRAVHLAAHIESRPLLSPEQIAAYNKLRGYGESQPQREHDPRKHH